MGTVFLFRREFVWSRVREKKLNKLDRTKKFGFWAVEEERWIDPRSWGGGGGNRKKFCPKKPFSPIFSPLLLSRLPIEKRKTLERRAEFPPFIFLTTRKYVTPERHKLAGDHRSTLPYILHGTPVLDYGCVAERLAKPRHEREVWWRWLCGNFLAFFPLLSAAATHWQGNGLGLAFFRRRPLPRFGKWRSREKKKPEIPLPFMSSRRFYDRGCGKAMKLRKETKLQNM